MRRPAGRAFAALALVALAACGGGPAQVADVGPSVPAPGYDTCNATPHGGLVGADATALERVLILDQIRLIRPGDGVTRDMRPGRINFEIDAQNRIARIFCG